MKPDTPANDEAEISLLGAGAGYGESLVIHTGNQNWIVIDSCKNPVTKNSLPLQYLNDINVNPQKVSTIICTHWHDDHIGGLHELLDACKTAKLFFSWPHDTNEFAEFFGVQGVSTRQNFDTRELVKCIKLLKTQQRTINMPGVDRLVMRGEGSNPYSVAMHLLSPSDEIKHTYIRKVAAYKDLLVKNKKIASIVPANMLSAAALLQLGNHYALLGADLEKENGANSGWNDILNNSEVIKQTKSGVFKIPHHGSSTGYEPLLWQQLLLPDAIGLLTPWRRGNKNLPTPDMVETYQKHTNQLFITSNATLLPPAEASFAKALLKKGIRQTPLMPVTGHIRCRLQPSHESAQWVVDCFDAACKI
jgi:beta-lactamase superfamily II metal-dependent hydrolase